MTPIYENLNKNKKIYIKNKLNFLDLLGINGINWINLARTELT